MSQSVSETGLVVIKIGGSLHTSGELSNLLKRIDCIQQQMIIVPGGGKYADAVRSRQVSDGFDDQQAHVLALKAMGEMAVEMAKLMQRGVVTETVEDIRDLLAKHNIPIWSPFRMMVNDPDLPADWSTTSDALAAHLAERTVATTLIVVKSIDVPISATPHQLAESGIVDPVFPGIVTRANLSCSVIGPKSYDLIESLLTPARTC